MSSPFPSALRSWLRFVGVWLGVILGAALPAASPVEFTFRVPAPAEPANPFFRELWAEVQTPAGRTLRLPAFYAREDRFAVRARREEVGRYRLGSVTETVAGAEVMRPAEAVGPSEVITTAPARAAVRLDPRDPRLLQFTDGRPYVPIGANLAWPTQRDRVGFYREGFAAFGRESLNWTRVWMSHWGGLNLDWLPDDLAPAPPLGQLDLRIAATWDQVLALAEEHGVYVQVVFQHHGQWSTRVNPNWDQNPWNAAVPGGFLARPGDFFTSPQARQLTRAKYRTFIARWAWSPAVLAWELFNEVHWVDAVRLDQNTAAVAAWHDEMAAYVRALDPYQHLVITSDDGDGSPVSASADYLQPHLYAPEMLVSVRRHDSDPAALRRPIFYGEIGDDHQPLSEEVKRSGVAIVAPVWAGLMGSSLLPPQLWLGDVLLDRQRLGELGAVARFLAATPLAGRDDLVPFTTVVDSAARVPLVLVPGQNWQRRPAPTVRVPFDGRDPVELADIPAAIVGSARSRADGYPERVTFLLTAPRDLTVRVQLGSPSPQGAHARAVLDGQTVAEHLWPAPPPREGEVEGEATAAPRRLPRPSPAELVFSVLAGEHTLVLDNPTGPDWFAIQRLDFGVDRPALAAVGKRSARFLALWVWRRDGVNELQSPPPVTGTVLVDDVPAGSWKITWWDTLQGRPTTTTTVSHAGGELRLPTPPIARHAAVVLER